MIWRIVLILLFVLSSCRIMSAQSADSVQCKLELRNAVEDASLGEEVRSKFADDDGRVMKSVDFDLNGDGKPEQFIPNEFLCGNGGCPWLVYSPQMRCVIGKIMANEILIMQTRVNGYNVLKCSWSTAGQTEFTYFVFNGQMYIHR